MTSRLLAAGVPTAAGRFFVPPPVAAAWLPALPTSMFGVHVRLEPGGFRVDGRMVTPRMLAKVIRACPEWSRRPVLVLPVGQWTGPEQAGNVFRALAGALDVCVLSCDAEVYWGARSVLTGGSFLCWKPPSRRDDSEPTVRRLGPVLPEILTAVGPDVSSSSPVAVGVPSGLGSVVDALLAAGSSIRLTEPLIAAALPELAGVENPSEPVDGPPSDSFAAPVVAQTAGARWTRVTGSAVREDRERLRALLGWRYEALARAVTGVLALQPGLRATPGADDLLAGLVAVRAHLSTTIGSHVDALLRGEAPDAAAGPMAQPGIDSAGVQLLARCTVSGLTRLPAAVGPVFRTGTPQPAVLAGYRRGDRLVEPAFAEARLTRLLPAGSTVEYAIWSTTGRRTDRVVDTDGADAQSPRVLFGAGSQFLVLDIDQPSTTGEPMRVLLREVAPSVGVDSTVDQRTRQRLRETLTVAARTGLPADQQVPSQWRHALGFRDDGAAFICPSPAKS